MKSEPPNIWMIRFTVAVVWRRNGLSAKERGRRVESGSNETKKSSGHHPKTRRHTTPKLTTDNRKKHTKEVASHQHHRIVLDTVKHRILLASVLTRTVASEILLIRDVVVHSSHRTELFVYFGVDICVEGDRNPKRNKELNEPPGVSPLFILCCFNPAPTTRVTVAVGEEGKNR